MIGFLMNTIGKWKLKRLTNAHKHRGQAVNLSAMKSAVFILHFQDEATYSAVTNFALNLRQKEGFETVDVLGYYAKPELPNFIDNTQVQVITDKELGWMGMPQKNLSEYLKKDRYDLMVDFTPHSFIPTDYFLSLVVAKTKVGKSSVDKEHIFDLMITLSKEDDLNTYISNIVRYLKMINKD